MQCLDCGAYWSEASCDMTLGEIIEAGLADDIDTASEYADGINSSDVACPQCGSENFAPLT